MRQRVATGRAAGAAVAALLAGAGVAAAQTAEYSPEFDPDPFVLTSDPTSIGLTESATPLERNALAVGLALRLSGAPLQVCVQQPGADECTVEGDVVSSRFASDLTFAYGLGKLGVHAQLPIILYQGSDFDPEAGQDALGAAGIGDLRLGAKAWLLRAGAITLGADLTVSLPTGGAQNFIGSSGLGIDPKVLVEWRQDRLAVGGQLGYGWRQQDAVLSDLYVNDELQLAVAGEYAITPDKLSAGLALLGRIGVVGPDEMTSPGGQGGEERPFELLASTRYWTSASLAVEGGLGLGLGDGYGPGVRALVGVRYVKRPVAAPVRPIDDDADDDGIVNSVDECDTDPEDKDGFEDADGCPDRDNDADGFADGEDSCPDAAEDKDEFEDTDGCPDNDDDRDGVADRDDGCRMEPEDVDGFQDGDGCPEADNDNDGLADASDGCPNDPEDVDQFDDADGCPDLDNDRDGIADASDACPLDAEVFNGVDDADGCPDQGGAAAVVTSSGVDINETIYFDTDKARIQRRSYKLLDAVAAALNANSTLRIRIEGHTDHRGSDEYNNDLSQRRAEAVREYLISKGVDGARLEAVGYGKTRPKIDNRGSRARSANRRVEFVIISNDAAPPAEPMPEPAPQP